jgi:hypothetical protein
MEQLRLARLRRGLSHAWLAAATGLRPSTILRLQRRAARPGRRLLARDRRRRGRTPGGTSPVLAVGAAAAPGRAVLPPRRRVRAAVGLGWGRTMIGWRRSLVAVGLGLLVLGLPVPAGAQDGTGAPFTYVPDSDHFIPFCMTSNDPGCRRGPLVYYSVDGYWQFNYSLCLEVGRLVGQPGDADGRCAAGADDSVRRYR